MAGDSSAPPRLRGLLQGPTTCRGCGGRFAGAGGTADVAEAMIVERNIIIAGAEGTTSTTQWLAFGRLQGTGVRVVPAMQQCTPCTPPLPLGTASAGAYYFTLALLETVIVGGWPQGHLRLGGHEVSTQFVQEMV